MTQIRDWMTRYLIISLYGLFCNPEKGPDIECLASNFSKFLLLNGNWPVHPVSL